MRDEPEALADIRFEGEVIEWRGPSPFYFVAVPPDQVGEVRYAARIASYGWGVVPVVAQIGDVEFRTSLFPKDEGYLLPLRDAVRKSARISLGDRLAITMRIYAKTPSAH